VGKNIIVNTNILGKSVKYNQAVGIFKKLPVIPCAYKLKAGIAYWNRPYTPVIV
jgi:hypothetical protein